MPWPNSAGAQDAFGFAQGVRLLLPFRVAWLSFWSLGDSAYHGHAITLSSASGHTLA
jgi:hypothetical protein